jgi:hypothetical protein
MASSSEHTSRADRTSWVDGYCRNSPEVEPFAQIAMVVGDERRQGGLSGQAGRSATISIPAHCLDLAFRMQHAATRMLHVQRSEQELLQGGSSDHACYGYVTQAKSSSEENEFAKLKRRS